MERLGIFTRYDRMGASSRLRFFQWKDDFAAFGFLPEFYPFFTEDYLKKLYSCGKKSKLSLLLAAVCRFFQLMRAPQKLLIEYELFPFLPAKWELLFLKRKRYFLGFDDNVWEKYKNNPALADKYDELIRHADGVIVANDFLYEKVKPLNDRILLLPTVIQLENYQEPAPPKPERFTIGWIGTPVTYRYLEAFAEMLQQASKEIDFDLKVIAAKHLVPISGVRMHFVDWSTENEIQELKSCHIGIMPLTDDAFSQGKSAFKLIQYLGAGLPAVASPIGENSKVITAETGFLASSPEEWIAALRQLAHDRTLRRKMGDAARIRAYEYSQTKYAPLLEKMLCGDGEYESHSTQK